MGQVAVQGVAGLQARYGGRNGGAGGAVVGAAVGGGADGQRSDQHVGVGLVGARRCIQGRVQIVGGVCKRGVKADGLVDAHMFGVKVGVADGAQ